MGDADGTLSHWCFNVREHMQGHIATHISTFFKITQSMVSHQLICQISHEHLCIFYWFFLHPRFSTFLIQNMKFLCMCAPNFEATDQAEYIHLDREIGPFSLRNLKYN